MMGTLDEDPVHYAVGLLEDYRKGGERLTIRLTSEAFAYLELPELQQMYDNAVSLTFSAGVVVLDGFTRSQPVDSSAGRQLLEKSIEAWRKVRDCYEEWESGIAKFVRSHFDQFSFEFGDPNEDLGDDIGEELRDDDCGEVQ